MQSGSIEEKQAWTTCLLTDILLTYLEENFSAKHAIDFPGLFRTTEGLEMPADPESFLKDDSNWVPLPILRQLQFECERISGRKDFSYLAARAYFERGKQRFPSLFEINIRILNDVRSVLICANLWGAVQTSNLKLQSFEKQGEEPESYILAQFDAKARPAIGSIQLIRGMFEGFPRLYPFIDDVRCVEEFSQLQIADVLCEFPNYVVLPEQNGLTVRHRDNQKAIVEAVKVPLISEVIPLSPEFLANMPHDVVSPPIDGRIAVLSRTEEPTPHLQEFYHAYRIIHPGTLWHENLSYAFEEGQIYNAPYCRFRFDWKEKPRQQRETSIENVRMEFSQLLFDHLKQARQTQTHMVQFNVDKRRLTLENIRLRQEIKREYSFAGIIGESRKMQDLFSLVRSAAETDVTVIIQGETGTGKELIARAIHYNSSRKEQRFVAINCGALSETLLESELFGHEKGAFTGAITQRKGIFEAADGGTLFLDEVSEITPSTQVKLLRVLQEGEFQRVGGSATIKVDVRIIAATNQNLHELVQKGPFRQDFYYRLNVFPIVVPPLRERPEDIPLLIPHFIEKCNQRMKKQISGATPNALAMMMAYNWPGNVRELENVVQRVMVVAKGEMIDIPDLPPEVGGAAHKPADKPKDLKEMARGSSEIVEKKAILDALSKTAGNITQAAKALGISRATLQNKMKAYNLRAKTNKELTA